jgi:hypothetical protein
MRRFGWSAVALIFSVVNSASAANLNRQTTDGCTHCGGNQAGIHSQGPLSRLTGYVCNKCRQPQCPSWGDPTVYPCNPGPSGWWTPYYFGYRHPNRLPSEFLVSETPGSP